VGAALEELRKWVDLRREQAALVDPRK